LNMSIWQPIINRRIENLERDGFIQIPMDDIKPIVGLKVGDNFQAHELFARAPASYGYSFLELLASGLEERGYVGVKIEVQGNTVLWKGRPTKSA